MTWGNPRWQRLLMWALRMGSPSHDMHVPTFREAWTGDTSAWWDEQGRLYREAFERGLRGSDDS
jgi:hypothetical protein